MAIHIMPDRDASGTKVVHQAPFKSKAVAKGNLFRRKHGFNKTITANSIGEIDIIVPYNACKINQVEFVNGVCGDTVDLQVLDTSTGLFSTIPRYMLNQFGFDVELPDGFYVDTSEYDASLVLDMLIKIIYKNNSSSDLTIRGNITFHEVK